MEKKTIQDEIFIKLIKQDGKYRIGEFAGSNTTETEEMIVEINRSVRLYNQNIKERETNLTHITMRYCDIVPRLMSRNQLDLMVKYHVIETIKRGHKGTKSIYRIPVWFETDGGLEQKYTGKAKSIEEYFRKLRSESSSAIDFLLENPNISQECTVKKQSESQTDDPVDTLTAFFKNLKSQKHPLYDADSVYPLLIGQFQKNGQIADGVKKLNYPQENSILLIPLWLVSTFHPDGQQTK